MSDSHEHEHGHTHDSGRIEAKPHRHHYDAEMLSVEEALERILSYFQVLDAEIKPLLEAQGQVLAEDLIAGFDIPSLANSAMDGFAVRAADVVGASVDTPIELLVIGKVAAGQLPDRPVVPGAAIRIMTGAPLPDGADAVVPFEDTDELERSDRSAIGIRLDAQLDENVRPPGEDVRSGEVVLARGATLGPSEIGCAASLGLGEVSVIRRPVVSIVAKVDRSRRPKYPTEETAMT